MVDHRILSPCKIATFLRWKKPNPVILLFSIRSFSILVKIQKTQYFLLEVHKLYKKLLKSLRNFKIRKPLTTPTLKPRANVKRRYKPRRHNTSNPSNNPKGTSSLNVRSQLRIRLKPLKSNLPPNSIAQILIHLWEEIQSTHLSLPNKKQRTIQTMKTSLFSARNSIRIRLQLEKVTL